MATEKYLSESIIPAIKAKVDAKQDKLVGEGDGQNIKTINGQTILGTGDIEIVDKLYDATGANTDGAMTQKATTDAIKAVEDKADANATKITDAEKEIDWVETYPTASQEVATHAALPTTGTANQIVKVTADETQGNAPYYYQYVDGAWTPAGPEMPYYRKGEADDKFATKAALESATGDITTIQGNITTINNTLTEHAGDIEALEGFAETTVQLDTTLKDDKTSTVTLIKKQAAINNAAAAVETEIPLPVASETQAGVINPATYASIQDSAEKIESILNASVAVADLPAEPTQEQLTTAWKTASGRDTLINGAKILDTTNNKTWTYYSNNTTWTSVDNNNPTIELANFTNTAAGQIKGDNTTDGKVQAEADGTGSVKGWDTVKTDIANNATEIASIKTDITNLGDTYALKTTVEALSQSVDDNAADIAALQADKQDKLVASGEEQNIKTVNGNSLLGTGDITIDVPEAMTSAEFEAAWNAA